MKKIFTLFGFLLFAALSADAQTMTLTVTTTAATNCTAPCNGTATAASQTVSGATYLWNTNPAQTTNTATGLCPGVYTCTVTLSPFGSASGSGTVTCSSANAVADVSVDENIILFPNPVSDEITLQADQLPDGKAELEVRNLMGVLVFSEKVEVRGPMNRTINVALWPAGIYDLQVRNGNHITRKQFVKE